jgi:uncharacterized membrane protein YphA (DoxX/SURF4 family)
MEKRQGFAHVGIYAYALGAIMLGISGLVWGDFATNWQRVDPDVPYREALAYLTAAYELCAGLAIFWPRTARIGAAMLGILYLIFALLWVPRIVASPLVYDTWGNFFEEFSIVIAAAVLYASLAPQDSVWAGRTGQISRCYGICVISFALVHLFYLKATASFVPKWIPPGQMFWAVTTAICFLLAAGAILSGILAGLASRLLTAMIVGFELLIWAPRLLASPHVHFEWAGNAVSMALAGGAWLVADAINDSPSLRVKAERSTALASPKIAAGAGNTSLFDETR